MLRAVASSCASFNAAPSSRKFTRLRSVAASQLGRGKLPIVVVAMGGSCIGFTSEDFSQAIYAPTRKHNSKRFDDQDNFRPVPLPPTILLLIPTGRKKKCSR